MARLRAASRDEVVAAFIEAMGITRSNCNTHGPEFTLPGNHALSIPAEVVANGGIFHPGAAFVRDVAWLLGCSDNYAIVVLRGLHHVRFLGPAGKWTAANRGCADVVWAAMLAAIEVKVTQ